LIEESAKELRNLNCDRLSGREFTDECGIGSTKYTLSKADSRRLTVVGIPVKGSGTADWGWISIPANTLEPGCTIEISQGTVPSKESSSTKSTSKGKKKNTQKCEDQDKKLMNVSPSASLTITCDGREVKSFPKGIGLQFLANLDKKQESELDLTCLGFREDGSEGDRDHPWSCIDGLKTKRISDTQVLFTSKTDHFTR